MKVDFHIKVIDAVNRHRLVRYNEPSHLYIGKKEVEELTQWAKEHFHMDMVLIPGLVRFYGLRVWPVDVDSHMKVF